MSSSATTLESDSPQQAMQFQPFSSAVDISFWSELGKRKLEVYHLDQSSKEIIGGFNTSKHEQVPSQLCLGAYSFQSDVNTLSTILTSSTPIPSSLPGLSFGVLHNANTMEAFKAFPITNMLDEFKNTMWRGWKDRLKESEEKSGQVTRSPSLTELLSRFLLLTFADLKSHKYAYWFCFPVLIFDAIKMTTTTPNSSKLSDAWNATAVNQFFQQFHSWEQQKKEVYFSIIHSPDGSVQIQSVDVGLHLVRHTPATKVTFGFIDPSPLSSNLGWPARNLLTYVAVAGLKGEVQLLALRDIDLVRTVANGKELNLDHITSRLFSIHLVCDLSSDELMKSTPKAVGWEKNKSGKSTPRTMDLGSMMDPIKLAESSVDLNLKLMRWRALPALDLPLLSRTRCLLLGAGTLGCAVSRCLLGWGVRNITFVDSGSVSYSNPVRQSLFNFEDAKQNKPKALAAAESLKQIHPSTQSRGVQMRIPMPGHQVSPTETADVLGSIRELEELIRDHDAIFLLTDSRESRWLPTLMCAAMNKLCLNTALGFDTYVVMRHGDNYGTGRKQALEQITSTSTSTSSTSAASASASSISNTNPHVELGCYFCNDVVAPTDSLSDRTLDQQCTVTRPGLAFISSAFVVELFVAILHHPLRQHAPADLDSSSVSSATSGTSGLGLVPHQLRGFLGRFTTTLVRGEAFNKCTACSTPILNAYLNDKEGFILKSLNGPTTFLEDLSGLTEMKRETERMFQSMEYEEGDSTVSEEDQDDF